jgi:hypothetical protein
MAILSKMATRYVELHPMPWQPGTDACLWFFKKGKTGIQK